MKPLERIRTVELASTPNPQRLCALAMHNDYSEKFIADEENWLSLEESVAGERVVKHALKYGHYGVCYDDRTEVLTESGFKKWSEVTEKDKLFSVNISDNTGQFEKPQELIKIKYQGEMINYDHQRVSLSVTPDHKLFVKTRVNSKGIYGDLKPVLAKDVFGRQLKMSSEIFLREGERFELPFTDNEVKLIGFWIGDGDSHISNKGRIKFHVRKPRKAEYLRSLGCLETAYENYSYMSERLGDFLKEGFLTPTKDKTIPKKLWKITYRQFKLLCEGLSLSDGKHRKSELQFTYCTSSPELEERLYVLFNLNGLSVKSYVEKNSEKNPNWRDSYQMAIHPRSEFRLEKSQQKFTEYDGFVYCAKVSTGALFIRREGVTVISGNCEHPHLTLAFSNVPHSVINQVRTHRVGVSFDIQSLRYTGKRYVDWHNRNISNQLSLEAIDEFENLFYIREAGRYADRFGNKIDYTEEKRLADLKEEAVKMFFLVRYKLIEDNMPFEMFRDFIPAGYRQNMIITGNARSWMHLLDLRLPKNAQSEIGYTMEQAFHHCKKWMPEVFDWYEQTRKGKNKLAP